MKKNKSPRHTEPEDTPNISPVASAFECTGLMPTPPESEAEQESYEELFSMALPKKKP